jgi:hypothetical protein
MQKRSKTQGKRAAESPEDVPIEPGADKRLANILKKALNTPPRHVENKRKKPAKAK